MVVVGGGGIEVVGPLGVNLILSAVETPIRAAIVKFFINKIRFINLIA